MNNLDWCTSQLNRRPAISTVGTVQETILFGETLVCVGPENRAERKWHFQLVHHPLWGHGYFLGADSCGHYG